MYVACTPLFGSPVHTYHFRCKEQRGSSLADAIAGLQLLQGKLDQMMLWLQDPTIKPEQRFQLLQEIGEEAARYKLGGDDKIRVAAGACDAVGPSRLSRAPSSPQISPVR